MRGYRLIDYLTQGYLGLVGLLILLFHGTHLPNWQMYFLAHVVCMAAIHGLVRLNESCSNRFVALLRAFYPMLLYTFLYWETHDLDSLFVHEPLDAVFIGLDRKLFGCDPSRDFILAVPYFPVSELLYGAYSTYYIMIPGVGFALYFRDRERFYQYVTVASFVFFVCFFIYIFLPVLGPHAQERLAAAGKAALLPPRAVPLHLKRGLFFRLMKFIYRNFEPKSGAAFPSSHVAVAIAAASYTWRYVKEVRWLHAVVVLLLAISTVYCGYHYAVDVFAGALAALALVPLGEYLYRKLARHAPPPPLAAGE